MKGILDFVSFVFGVMIATSAAVFSLISTVVLCRWLFVGLSNMLDIIVDIAIGLGLMCLAIYIDPDRFRR